ncbi:MAG: hypothetical protein J5649_11115 [Lachnospiraceae bacterium]|nr:hypothetical protein [Lachnospiraceae bacterium]
MKKYVKAELELIDIETENAILTSCGDMDCGNDGTDCDNTYDPTSGAAG